MPPENEHVSVQVLKRPLALFLASWPSFAAAIIAGVFLSLSSAFGTASVALPLRLLYWVPVLLIGTLIGHYAGRRIARRPRVGENALLLWGVITLLLTGIMTLMAWAYLSVIIGKSPYNSIIYFFAPVGLVVGVVTAVMMLLNRPGPATHAATLDTRAGAGAARFLGRVPGKLKGGVIYAVQAEDHYLRIRTSKGSDLILMRLSDAIAELDGIEGAQTHRSWWVAKDGIGSVSRTNGRVTLQLKDGAEAPVSRPNLRALRETGWI